ncbi:hypothetical protein WJX73_006348 [Symbiochloris irregularis]|uniref:Uncharacterized protein n=1 Tax=Symbiochloris irregularis TaxID=706552 RepID=A0AAW1NU84_9CHLO
MSRYSRRGTLEYRPDESLTAYHERCQAAGIIPVFMRTAQEAKNPQDMRVIRNWLRMPFSWIRIGDSGIVAASLSIGVQDQANVKLLNSLMGISHYLVLSGRSQPYFEEKHASFPDRFIRVTWLTPQIFKAAAKAADRGEVVMWPFSLALYSQSHPDDAFRDILLPERSADKVLVVFSVWLPNRDQLNVFFQVPVGAFPQNDGPAIGKITGWEKDEGFNRYNAGQCSACGCTAKLLKRG